MLFDACAMARMLTEIDRGSAIALPQDSDGGGDGTGSNHSDHSGVYVRHRLW